MDLCIICVFGGNKISFMKKIVFLRNSRKDLLLCLASAKVHFFLIPPKNILFTY